MVEVEMCEYDIRNILTGNAPPLEFFPQIDQVEEVVIAELFQVFVARPVVDEYDLPAFVTNQHAAHGQDASVLIIAWITAVPGGLGNRAEHGASVRMEKAGVYKLNIHKLYFSNKDREVFSFEPVRRVNEIVYICRQNLSDAKSSFNLRNRASVV